MRRSRFSVVFLTEADEFLQSLPDKARKKIIFNIDLVSKRNDPKLFKKLNEHIWEFRTYYAKTNYRLFAFWDKTEKEDVLVIATHGMIKKAQKIEKRELDKTERIRIKYFSSKDNQ